MAYMYMALHYGATCYGEIKMNVFIMMVLGGQYKEMSVGKCRAFLLISHSHKLFSCCFPFIYYIISRKEWQFSLPYRILFFKEKDL